MTDTSTVVSSAQLSNGNVAEVLLNGDHSGFTLNVLSTSGAILSSQALNSFGYTAESYTWDVVAGSGGSFIAYYNGASYAADGIYDNKGNLINGFVSGYHDFANYESAQANPDGSLTYNYVIEDYSGNPFFGPVSASISYYANGVEKGITQYAYYSGYGANDVGESFDKDGNPVGLFTDYGSYSGKGWTFNFNYTNDAVYSESGSNSITGAYFSTNPVSSPSGYDGGGYQTFYHDPNGNDTSTYVDISGFIETDITYAVPINGATGTTMIYNTDYSTVYTIHRPTGDIVTTNLPDGSKTIEYYVQNLPYADQTVSYDSDGNQTKLERDYVSGAPQMISTYTNGSLSMTTDYDTSGRVIETDKYGNDGSHTVTLNTFASSVDTKPLKSALYTYDASNHLATLNASYAYAIPYHEITAFQAGQTLIAPLHANSNLYGASAGGTTFEFDALSANEADQLFNFVASGANHDVINISKSLASNYQALQTHIHDGYIDFGTGETILLHNGNINSIPVSDFHFI